MNVSSPAPFLWSSGTLSITNPNLWTKSGNHLYFNDISTNIGIGKTNPGYTLDISENINFTGNLTKLGLLLVILLIYLDTSATASSTYQTQSGMSTYLTTSSASSTYQTKLTANQNSPLYLDGSNVKIKTDSCFISTPNPTAGNSRTLSTANPNLWTYYLL